LADIQRRKIGDNRSLGPLLERLTNQRNSDYFPFVDLNAPRLRYLDRNAVELSRLTNMPMPFLELLRAESPVRVTVPPGANSVMTHDRLVRQALAIRSAVSTGKLDVLDAGNAANLLIIDSSRERCAEAGTQAAWKLAVRQVSDATSAYLAPAELADVWGKITASACYRGATREDKLWPDLLTAVARRDASEIQTLGTQLLDGKTLSDEERGYLTTIVGAASLRLGQADGARKLLETEWGRLAHPGIYDFALSNLLVLSGAGSPVGTALAN
jgi:hypothetical protein